MTVPLLPGLDVSRETHDRLHILSGQVTKWTTKINLISPATVPVIWQRHILDSAQLVLAVTHTPTSWVDLGSGAGLPGLVVAILAAERWPALRVALVESDQRKAAFLRATARELGLAPEIHAARSESLPPQNASVVSARALAPLVELLPHAQRHMAKDGIAIFPKGRNYQQEIDAARHSWRFALAMVDSLTDHEARVLRIERIARA